MSKLFIGPYETGLQKNLEPWLLPNEAFVEIEDAYVWRGRIKRKNGYRMLQRLHLTPTLPEAHGNAGLASVAIAFIITNAFVSPGTVIIRIAVPAVGPDPAYNLDFVDNGNGTLTRPLGETFLGSGVLFYGFGTINYLTGAVSLNWNLPLPAISPVSVTQYRYWPLSGNARLPVMGLYQYERPAINREDLLAFDTTYSYLYNSGTTLFDVQPDSFGNFALWSGSNSDFMWGVNYYWDSGHNYLFWATNGLYNTIPAGVALNGIYIYNGIAWYSQTPQLNATTFLRGCLLLVPYRNRMVALNTWEGATIGGANPVQQPARARWCQNGVPYVSGLGGAVANAWRDDTPGLGGYIDAPTTEAIVSARFFKDTLIVFFENSTWELRYTGNEILPFIWYKINADLGCESTYSTVQFDDGVYAIGDKRITVATSVQVLPIDTKIPDTVFQIENENEGIARVHGIRDYFKKFVYWSIPTALRDQVFPDKVLSLNYEEGTYSFFNDTFTCFGYYQPNQDYTWATVPWIWSEWSLPWGAAQMQAWFPNVVAGNQDGNVLILDQQENNAPAFDLLRNGVAGIPAISNTSPAVFYSPNHNFFGTYDSAINYYNGNYIKPHFVRGFAINVVGEALGTAQVGSTQFTASFGGSITPWCGYIILSATVTMGALTFIDLGNGSLVDNSGTFNVGTIDYEGRIVTINYAALGVNTPVTITYSYNVLNYRTFTVTELSPNTFTLSSINDNGTLSPLNLNGFAAYNDWAVMQMVNNFYFKTKTFDPFIQKSEGTRLNYLDLYTSIGTGQISVNFYVGESDSQIAQTLPFNLYKSTNINSIQPTKIWKRMFPSLTSDMIQLEFQFSSVQMRDRNNYNSLFEMHAMILDVAACGRIIGYS